MCKEEKDAIQEILWGMNFQRLIDESVWLKDKSIKAGESAVGHYYLHILYSVLDMGYATSVLDIGMGQSTKLISQYALYNNHTKHYVVENDREWIDFFLPTLKYGKNTEIIKLNCQMKNIGKETVRIYEDFAERFKDKKFDLISIDGPLGTDMKSRSRIDILDVLPECLKTSFVVLVDDVDRMGESNLVDEICGVLKNSHIEYVKRICRGMKSFAVICSKDRRFFCSI